MLHTLHACEFRNKSLAFRLAGGNSERQHSNTAKSGGLYHSRPMPSARPNQPPRSHIHPTQFGRQSVPLHKKCGRSIGMARASGPKLVCPVSRSCESPRYVGIHLLRIPFSRGRKSCHLASGGCPVSQVRETACQQFYNCKRGRKMGTRRARARLQQ